MALQLTKRRKWRKNTILRVFILFLGFGTSKRKHKTLLSLMDQFLGIRTSKLKIQNPYRTTPVHHMLSEPILSESKSELNRVFLKTYVKFCKLNL